MTLRTLNYGNSGIFLIRGNAGFCPSTVGFRISDYESWFLHKGFVCQVSAIWLSKARVGISSR